MADEPDGESTEAATPPARPRPAPTDRRWIEMESLRGEEPHPGPAAEPPPPDPADEDR
jgi:hypothetical protein